MINELKEPDIPILKIAREAILRDHTGLADTINKMIGVIRGYDWIARGEWGSYEYHEQTKETLQKEISYCFQEILKIGNRGLNESGNRSFAWVNEIETKISEARNKRYEPTRVPRWVSEAIVPIANEKLEHATLAYKYGYEQAIDDLLSLHKPEEK